MSLFSKLFGAFGVFLVVAGVVYGVIAGDYEGLTLSLTVAGGALLFGGYASSALRRARTTLGSATESTATSADDSATPATSRTPTQPATQTRTPPAAEAAADAEPHVGPTIWPLVFAVSAIGLVVGAVAVRWVLLPGAILFVLAGVGWVLDVHRQWHHHAAGLSGHGSGVLEAVSDLHTEPGLEPGRPIGPSTDVSTEPDEASASPPAADLPPGQQSAAAENGRRR
jgi:hypothetical protein